MKQMTLARGGFEPFGKTTERAAFLAETDQVLPWGELCALIAPHYPNSGGPGRPSAGAKRMLRVHFLQHWFNLSDPAVEEALYEWVSMREFVGIDLGQQRAPDETTICTFRHLLERHDLGRQIFEQVGVHLQAKGFRQPAVCGCRPGQHLHGAPRVGGISASAAAPTAPRSPIRAPKRPEISSIQTPDAPVTPKSGGYSELP